MSKVMLYRHPRTIKGNDADKGHCVIKGVEFDWIIVKDDEVEACLKEGFYKNPDDAIGAEDEKETTTEIAPELIGLTAEDENVKNIIDSLSAYTKDEIKDSFTVEELKEVAISLGIKRISRMNEDTLISKILEVVGE